MCGGGPFSLGALIDHSQFCEQPKQPSVVQLPCQLINQLVLGPAQAVKGSECAWGRPLQYARHSRRVGHLGGAQQVPGQ